MRVSPCGFDGSFIEPFGVYDSELISGGNPFSDTAARLLKAADGEVNQLCGCVIRREAAACFGGFADDAVQAFDGVGGVDDFTHRWWEGKKRDNFLPCPPPDWGD